MQKRWRYLPVEEDLSAALHAQLKIHPLLCQLLVQRGINTYEEAFHYFRPQLEHLHSPWLMKDMEKAVQRISDAIQQNEKILVFGDYDVDGTTAVASFYSFLKKIHSSLDFYIPHRYREGYGISKAGIDFAREHNFTLIVSLDCGIKSVELIAYAKTLGIDFVVCDHHLPDAELPVAAAILNPKQSDCQYPYKELCGCGVGFKLMQALAERLSLPPSSYMDTIDLVATAIAADIVPITGENRVLAFFGLKKANENPNAGIKVLSKLAGLQQEMHINSLVFLIAPRVNAAGRMDDARKAVELFLAESEAEALIYAEQLHQDNSDRKEADQQMLKEALALIETNGEEQSAKSTVLYQPHWHKGVVGIVASRVIENYYRPTIILTQSGEYAAGSARSVPGFNLYEAIHACREYLIGYGGHFAAAGMTLLPENIEPFRRKFDEVVSSSITDELLIPEIKINSEIRLSDISWNFWKIIAQMEPFGPENDRPVWVVKKVKAAYPASILKERHLKVQVTDGKSQISAIGMGMAHLEPFFSAGKPVDIAFKLDVNEWNGQKSLQMRLLDVKFSEQAEA